MYLVRIDIYSHNIAVSEIDPSVRSAVMDTLRPLVQMKWIRLPGGRNTQVPDRTYASANKERTEYRLARASLEELLWRLKMRGCDGDNIKTVTHEFSPAVKVKFTLNPEFVPRDYQVPVLDFIQKNPDPMTILPLQTGKGKAISLNSLVKVPGSWKLMADIRVGDQVTAWDGSITNVVGVYPQPVKQLYTVTFWDGRKVEACGEHLWEVFYINTSPQRRWRVVDTVEMLRLISMPNPRVYVRLCEPEKSVEKEYPVDPYLMGALLGDGHIGKNSITITKGDSFVIDKVGELIGPGHYLTQSTSREISWGITSRTNTNFFIRTFKDLGLAGKLSHEKFIPTEYLYGSEQQRWSLLQGLMDTDGTVNVRTSGASVSYSTTSEKLADNVIYLVRSLGGIAKKSTKKPYFTYKGVRKEGRLAYQVNIRLKKPSDAFLLPRKKERAVDDGQYNDVLKLRVLSVVPSRKGLSQCITVDHPDSLFIVNDFIVTHNTAIGLFSAVSFGFRTLIQIRGKYIDSWIHDIEEILGIKKKGELLVIRGEKDFTNLQHMAIDGILKAKIIIVSTDTYRGYIDRAVANEGTDLQEPILPIDFCKTLGIGFKIVDESHEVTHMATRIDTYTHVEHSLFLSATMESGTEFINKIYALYYPVKYRCDLVEHDKYIQATALMYRFRDPSKLKTSHRKGMYSHAAFEASILINKNYLAGYLKMHGDVMASTFIEQREEGQKLLFICATVEMCKALAEYLRQRFPFIARINSFLGTQGDALEVLKNSDVSVSTFLSAGTGKDVPGLRWVIMSLSVNSMQSSRQALGRLRRLKDWPDVTPIFYYLVCEDIPKQIEFHRNKYEIFKGLVIGHNELVLSERV